jgi:hypothetical protein
MAGHLYLLNLALPAVTRRTISSPWGPDPLPSAQGGTVEQPGSQSQGGSGIGFLST